MRKFTFCFSFFNFLYNFIHPNSSSSSIYFADILFITHKSTFRHPWPFHLRAKRLRQALAQPRGKTVRRVGQRLDDRFFDFLPLTGKAALHRVIRHQFAHQQRQFGLHQRLFHAALADQRQ